MLLNQIEEIRIKKSEVIEWQNFASFVTNIFLVL